MSAFDGSGPLLGALLAAPTGGASLIPGIVSGVGSALGGIFGGGGQQQRQSFQGQGTSAQQSLTDPENSLYNALSSILGAGQAFADRSRQPINVPGASIHTQGVNIPGMPPLEPVNLSAQPFSLPGLNLPSSVFATPTSKQSLQDQLATIKQNSPNQGRGIFGHLQYAKAKKNFLDNQTVSYQDM